jgi:hypothetical protein
MTVAEHKQFYINVTENQKTDALTRLLEMETADGRSGFDFSPHENRRRFFDE